MTIEDGTTDGPAGNRSGRGSWRAPHPGAPPIATPDRPRIGTCRLTDSAGRAVDDPDTVPIPVQRTGPTTLTPPEAPSITARPDADTAGRTRRQRTTRRVALTAAAGAQAVVLVGVVVWISARAAAIEPQEATPPVAWVGMVRDTGGAKLNLRTAPEVGLSNAARTASSGDQLQIVCAQTGDTVSGDAGRTGVWLKTSDQLYVSGLYVTVPGQSHIPRCPEQDNLLVEIPVQPRPDTAAPHGATADTLAQGREGDAPAPGPDTAVSDAAGPAATAGSVTGAESPVPETATGAGPAPAMKPDTTGSGDGQGAASEAGGNPVSTGDGQGDDRLPDEDGTTVDDPERQEGGDNVDGGASNETGPAAPVVPGPLPVNLGGVEGAPGLPTQAPSTGNLGGGQRVMSLPDHRAPTTSSTAPGNLGDVKRAEANKDTSSETNSIESSQDGQHSTLASTHRSAERSVG